MSINLQAGVYTPPQILPGARSTDIQVAQKQIESSPEISLPTPQAAEQGEAVSPQQQRYEQVLFAATGLVKDFYPISDKTFTIFKDSSGQYVTRYTSLRDGRVTYIPELKLLQQFEATQKSLKNAVQLQA